VFEPCLLQDWRTFLYDLFSCPQISLVGKKFGHPPECKKSKRKKAKRNETKKKTIQPKTREIEK